MTRVHAAVWALLLPALACSAGERPPSTRYGFVGGAVARVGDVTIEGSLVSAVATARGTTASAALAMLIEDALGAEAGHASGLDRAPGVGWASTTALARSVASRIAVEAADVGAPTSDELSMLRVIHVVVLRRPTLDPTKAMVVAHALESGLAGAHDDRDFEARAHAIAHDLASVTVERLPEFDAAGRMPDGRGLDPTFVAAAFLLRSPGDTSKVVETPFGWHVLRLLARTPPNDDTNGLDERRSELAPAVVEMRRRGRMLALLQARRERTPVEVSAAADELMLRAVEEMPEP